MLIHSRMVSQLAESHYLPPHAMVWVRHHRHLTTSVYIIIQIVGYSQVNEFLISSESKQGNLTI